jgi:hypothetical protein
MYLDTHSLILWLAAARGRHSSCKPWSKNNSFDSFLDHLEVIHTHFMYLDIHSFGSVAGYRLEAGIDGVIPCGSFNIFLGKSLSVWLSASDHIIERQNYVLNDCIGMNHFKTLDSTECYIPFPTMYPRTVDGMAFRRGNWER